METTLKSQSSLNNATIEINFVDANSDPNLAVLGFNDLPDEHGVKNSDSHYVASLIQDEQVIATATGLTPDTAIVNCYTQYAVAKAVADLDRIRFEDAYAQGCVDAYNKGSQL